MASDFFDVPAGQSAHGLALLLWGIDPDDKPRLATPFVYAAAAAALELPVEIYFTARSVHLLVPGVAEGLRASALYDRTIAETMQQAHEHGARFFVCTDAWNAQGLQGTPRISACEGHGGAVQFMARAADLRWRTMVF